MTLGQVENLSQHENEKNAVLRMEREILNGDPIDYETLFRLPKAIVLNSPLLTKAYGEKQGQSGNLIESVQMLSAAVKGLANQGLQHHMLDALANLAMIHLRTGNLSEANTILVFLREEFRRGQAGDSGYVAHALAKGVFLLEEREREQQHQQQHHYVRAAFEYYAKESQFSAYGAFLLDVWTGLVPQEELVMWEAQAAWMEQKARLGQAPATYGQFVQGMNSYYQAHWDDAARHFAQIEPSVLGYYHSALARVFQFRTRCRRQESFDSLTENMNQLVQLLREFEVDLELQFYAEVVKHEWCRMQSDYTGAADTRQKANVIHRLALFPYQARELAAMDQATEPGWRIYCFGRLKFIRNGQEVGKLAWKRKKTQELLIYLLLQPHYAAPRDRVVELLYGDTDMEKMANRLYVAIHELKRMAREHLGIQNIVEIKEGMIRLNERMVDHVDVEQYMALVRVGEQLWSQDRELSLEMFERAWQLYGELVPEMFSIDWLEQYREVLAEKQAGMLRRLAQQAAIERRFGQAELYIAEWLRIRPLQEEAHYEMISLFINDGRKAEAINWYEKWERLCRSELGLPPMAETWQLIARASQ